MNDNPGIIESFTRDVGGFLDARHLLPPGGAVVVGVSGGADSVALLEVLRRLASTPGRQYRLTVAHLNHGLRADAEADADFVADLARRQGLPCVVSRRDVRAEARAAGQGIEQAARAARYEFLRQTASAAGASHVAVAHHADDNAETILYRIVRGTHLRGLAGIPETRDLEASGIQLVRPLLERTRQEIEVFCRAAGLAWRTDATNADTGYRRNFIRHELLPLLRSRLNRRAEEALLRLAQAARQADEVLSLLARAAIDNATLPRRGGANEVPPKGISLEASVLAGEHPLVQTVGIRMILEDLGVPMRSLDAGHLAEVQEMIVGSGPAAIVLPGGWTARMEEGRLVVAPSPAPATPSAATPTPQAVVLECPGRTSLADGRHVDCRIEPFDPAAFAKHCEGHPPGEELLDGDQLRGRLVCRPRRRGDAFLPLGAPGRQSVSDFLTNMKLPPAQRERVCCICDELGIVYLAPLRIDDRIKVTPATREVLRIRVI